MKVQYKKNVEARLSAQSSQLDSDCELLGIRWNVFSDGSIKFRDSVGKDLNPLQVAAFGDVGVRVIQEAIYIVGIRDAIRDIGCETVTLNGKWKIIV